MTAAAGPVASSAAASRKQGPIFPSGRGETVPETGRRVQLLEESLEASRSVCHRPVKMKAVSRPMGGRGAGAFAQRPVDGKVFLLAPALAGAKRIRQISRKTTRSIR